MKMVLNGDETKILQRVARENNTTTDKLYDLYKTITIRNFFDDLMDIARENEKELG